MQIHSLKLNTLYTSIQSIIKKKKELQNNVFLHVNGRGKKIKMILSSIAVII